MHTFECLRSRHSREVADAGIIDGAIRRSLIVVATRGPSWPFVDPGGGSSWPIVDGRGGRSSRFVVVVRREGSDV